MRERLKTHDICARLLKSTAGACSRVRQQTSNEYARRVASSIHTAYPSWDGKTGGRYGGGRTISTCGPFLVREAEQHRIGRDVRTAFPVPKHSHAREDLLLPRGELSACDSIEGGLDVQLPRDQGAQRV